MIVELNNNVVFSGTLPKGKAAIPFPIAQINDGSNSIRLSVASSVTTSAYSLKDVNFVEQRYVTEKASAVQTLALATQELQGLISAKLTAYAKQIAQPATLTLALNDIQIYSASLSADTSIALDLPTSMLNNSINTLKWTVNKGGDYQILFTQVDTKYAKTPVKIKSYSFFVTDIEYARIGAGELSCSLSITALEPVTQTITTQINAYKLDLELQDGQISGYNLCAYLQPGYNTFSLQTSTPIDISDLKLLVAGQAYGV